MDMECEGGSDEEESSNQYYHSEGTAAISRESEPSLFAMVVDLLEEGLQNAQVIKELLRRHAVTRSVSWLEKFKRKHCLSKKRPEFTLLEQSNNWIVDVKECVYKGYKAAELQYHLKVKWGVTIGRTRLWKILKMHGISLTDAWIPDNVVEQLIATETANKPGIGYRGMTDIIRLRYNVKIARRRIHASMKQANPQLSASRLGNVMFRRVYGSRGVNAVWHFDGYDKLSRFGFGIHCCTDGLSRKYMWWYVGSTNRLSVRVAGHYVKAVEQAGWRPDITRTDFGSENVVVATIQGYYSDFLGLTHDGHIYGTSKRNTRIEGGWRILSRDNLKFWKT
ncbi:hypothetical protein BDR26DRAFT_940596 [Obelidium mucronatum]|nr:hypothetical protein BDR26DRAFT_940596 [Obelidium mucronatum]